MTRPVSVSHELLRRMREHLCASYRPGEALPSQRALADLYGASASSVHRTLTRLAAEGLVEARPRAQWVRAGEAAPARSTLRLGLITRRSLDEFRKAKLDEPYRSLFLEAERRGLPVVPYYNPRAHHPTPARNRIDWPLVPWPAFDVALLVECENPASLSDPLLRSRRVLAVDQDARIFGLHSVCCDDRGAGREAARHLWHLGHRRFALMDDFNLLGWPGEPTWLARRQGFEEMVLRLGGALHPDWRVPAARGRTRDYDWKGALRATAARWAALPAGRRPTALLVTDLSAFALFFEALQEHDLRIPRDLSAIGFRWRSPARTRTSARPLRPRERPTLPGPNLTSIGIDAQALARRALDAAQEWFEQGQAFTRDAEPRLFTSPFVLEPGESVATANP